MTAKTHKSSRLSPPKTAPRAEAADIDDRPLETVTRADGPNPHGLDHQAVLAHGGTLPPDPAVADDATDPHAQEG